MTRRGFTLLEVLVALAILGLATASVFQLLGLSARNAVRAQSTSRGVLVAESLMEELLALSEDALRARGRTAGERVVPDAAAAGWRRGRARAEDPVAYGWEVRVTSQPEDVALYRVDLHVRWEEPFPGAVELATLRRFSSPDVATPLE